MSSISVVPRDIGESIDGRSVSGFQVLVLGLLALPLLLYAMVVVMRPRAMATTDNTDSPILEGQS
jgi:hypothetical protein